MRNADGSVMASSAVSLTFMIHDGTATGTVVYQESHALNSNAQGLVSCVVGSGVVSQGNFEQINWGGGAKFLQVMMGSTDLGTQQMLSVPYALYAGACDISVSASGDTLFSGKGNYVIIPGISAANATNHTPPTSGLGAVVLPGNSTCVNEYINVVGCNGQSSLTYDGRTYDLVEIGGQCWFADNLATDQYRNGDPIPTGLDNTTWQNTTAGAYAIYNNDPANDVTYGKLYNWYTTVDTRGLCPSGWHVPTDCEWMYLEGSLGMSVQQQELANVWRGTNEGGAMKTITNWISPNVGANDNSGLSVLPGGFRYDFGNYAALGTGGLLWTSSVFDSNSAWNRNLDGANSLVLRDNTGDRKHHGFSVRCLKDSDSLILQGCTDGSACNFVASATQDDGSCLYQNATCNDGNANTTNDVIDANCQCAGTATGNGVFVPGNGVMDIDGTVYTSIVINGQEWMQQNLAVSKYRNGDPILTGLDNATWSSTSSGAYAIYSNDAVNNTIYGKLYNWYAVNDSRGLCPIGWHVPSDAEWTTLETSLGGSAVAGGKMKLTTGWNTPNTSATNSSGFTGLPGGYLGTNGTYGSIGLYGYWWSSSEFDSYGAWFLTVNYNFSNTARDTDSGRHGFSVRCVRD